MVSCCPAPDDGADHDGETGAFLAVESGQPRALGVDNPLLTWLHSINGYAKVNKMLGVSIQ